jgi:hypothetical protein
MGITLNALKDVAACDKVLQYVEEEIRTLEHSETIILFQTENSGKISQDRELFRTQTETELTTVGNQIAVTTDLDKKEELTIKKMGLETRLRKIVFTINKLSGSGMVEKEIELELVKVQIDALNTILQSLTTRKAELS